jgi:hypothetical protein
MISNLAKLKNQIPTTTKAKAFLWIIMWYMTYRNSALVIPLYYTFILLIWNISPFILSAWTKTHQTALPDIYFFHSSSVVKRLMLMIQRNQVVPIVAFRKIRSLVKERGGLKKF